MTTGLGCKICNNNFGEVKVIYQQGKILVTTYVCAMCAGDKSEDELFRQVIGKGAKHETAQVSHW